MSTQRMTYIHSNQCDRDNPMVQHCTCGADVKNQASEDISIWRARAEAAEACTASVREVVRDYRNGAMPDMRTFVARLDAALAVTRPVLGAQEPRARCEHGKTKPHNVLHCVVCCDPSSHCPGPQKEG